jgi:hypothetical protein
MPIAHFISVRVNLFNYSLLLYKRFRLGNWAFVVHLVLPVKQDFLHVLRILVACNVIGIKGLYKWP